MLHRPGRWFASAVLATAVLSCAGPGGCACGGFTPRPQGSFTGTKVDSAGAFRLTSDGFTFLNQNSAAILDLFAPGSSMVVPLKCAVQNVTLLGDLTIADDGTLYCTSESCGQMDGRCDANDLPHPITINITSLTFAPKSPDVLEATIHATVQTGKIYISTVSRNSPLCLFQRPAKCGVDFDTARAAPGDNELAVNIRFSVDTRWDRLLSLEVADIGGSKACGAIGAEPLPRCLDPNDIVITNESTQCSACTVANFSLVKTLIVDQLTNSLKDQLNKALSQANCARCTQAQACPTSPVATARCELDAGTADAGTCLDTGTNRCVPGLIGTEGVLDLGQAMGPLGVPPTSALELSLGAGGGATASASGLTVGMRGGFKEVAVADCVKAATRPAPSSLPLPDFDLDAPGPYDVGVSVSQQALGEALFHAQQAGAMCLELGTESVAVLDSSLLATVLPSLGRLTQGESRPVRLVFRPVNPPTAVVGAGTVDANGRPLEPLLRLDWQGLEIDAYALLDDRLVRLFTLTTNLSLPLGIEVDGCDGLTPIVGDLNGAIRVVGAANSDVLAEDPSALGSLVPLLLTFAEPQLARGLQKFQLPGAQGFKLKLLEAKGVGRIAATAQFNHLGLYAEVQPQAEPCTPLPLRAAPSPIAQLRSWSAAGAELLVPPGVELSWRLNGGFWSTWQRAGSDGLVTVRHPRLLLDAAHSLELRTRDGALTSVRLDHGARRGR